LLTYLFIKTESGYLGSSSRLTVSKLGNKST